MPEGDTIFRTATNLRKWLNGRTVTEARVRDPGVPIQQIVGATVDDVEPRGKHLLMRFSTGHVLHTHMRMTGSWHVYRAGDRWRAPAANARLVLTCGDRIAVCFNAPVVELLWPREEARHGALAGLGPDVLSPSFDVDEAVRRARAAPPDITLGELLLDQQIVAGLGNIWRCESLFVARRNPWTPRSALDDGELRNLISTGARLIGASAGGARGERWVYGRAGRPCRWCRTPIRRGRLGAEPRTVYWCPQCQPGESG